MKKIYLAFINHHLPPLWNQLGSDLARCLPFQFDYTRVDIDLRLYYSAERNQYHSTLILSNLLKYLPSDGEKILGVTNVDIFIPILTFLFGEAQLNGKGALVSTFRLRNEFYGLPAKPPLLYQRMVKEVLHELGHNLGLVHCSNYECVMNSSTYVEDIDLKKPRLCSACQSLLDITCREQKWEK